MSTIHHSTHAESTTHTSIEDHGFELSVGTETHKYGHQVIDCDQENYSRCKRLVFELRFKCACLDPQSDSAEVGEKIDRYIDDVNDKAAEVTLCQGTEQDCHIYNLVYARHRCDKAQANC